MGVYDGYRSEEFNGIKLPKLEGHVKFKLHNCMNHKDEVVFEGKNVITNAVRDIFANNLLCGLDMDKLLPLASKWFGGILLFENAHPLIGGNLDPDSYYPQNNTDNPLTAHAGDTAPATQEIVNEDLGRGSPSNTITTASSVKHIWEWGPSQGNGSISALSLTHADTGNVGLGNTSSAFKAYSPFERIDKLANLNSSLFDNGIVAQYDDRHGINYLIGDEGEYTPTHYLFQTSKITVNVRPLAYMKAGLLDAISPVNAYTRTFTVNTSINFYSMPAFYFDYTNKRLWLFTNKTSASPNTDFSKTVINYTVIDCVNQTEYSYGTLTSDASDLGMICVNGSYDSRPYPRVINILKDGNYFCFPTGTDDPSKAWQGVAYYDGLKKININNQSDQEAVTYNDIQTYSKPYVNCGGLLVNGDRVINGATGYTCGNTYFTDNESSNPYVGFWAVHDPYSVSSLVTPNSANRTSNYARYILAKKLLLTSLYNLPGTVIKGNTSSMIVEYTITEV